jgi:hypothetical protein
VALVFAGGASAYTEPGLTYTYADFSNCPVPLLSIGGANGKCLHAYVTGGAVQIGHAIVPISVPGDTFDEGQNHSENHTELCIPLTPLPPGTCVVSGQHGILNGPAQPVPSGLLGSIGNAQLTGVQAKLEWALPIPPETVFGQNVEGGSFESPFAVINEPGLLDESNSPGLVLTAKIHLLSPFLGPNCYIGSQASSIVIHLTTGATSPPPPNASIHGSFGNVSITNADIGRLVSMRLVDNSFSVPVASGCGTSGGGLLDGAIDRKLGLPSAAGHNSALILTNADFAATKTLLAHGWTGE